jgi:hypothetical protein
MDVEIETSYGTTIEEDNDYDPWGIVVFSVDYTRTLGIKMTNFLSNSPRTASYCRFLVFYR